MQEVSLVDGLRLLSCQLPKNFIRATEYGSRYFSYLWFQHLLYIGGVFLDIVESFKRIITVEVAFRFPSCFGRAEV